MIKKILLSLIALGVAWCLICLGLIFSQLHARPASLENVQTILVLGSKIDGTNAENARPAEVTRERLEVAICLAKEVPRATIIVSGRRGADEPVSEAAAMAAYLEAAGIAQSRIIQENRATNTSENLKFSKAFIKGKTVLVTSDFHVYRSMLLARKLGMTDISAYAARTKINNPLLFTGYFAHEILGISYALVFGN